MKLVCAKILEVLLFLGLTGVYLALQISFWLISGYSIAAAIIVAIVIFGGIAIVLVGICPLKNCCYILNSNPMLTLHKHHITHRRDWYWFWVLAGLLSIVIVIVVSACCYAVWVVAVVGYTHVGINVSSVNWWLSRPLITPPKVPRCTYLASLKSSCVSIYATHYKLPRCTYDALWIELITKCIIHIK
jgi:hypothetical protein